jgi:hypothetical protein
MRFNGKKSIQFGEGGGIPSSSSQEGHNEHPLREQRGEGRGRHSPVEQLDDSHPVTDVGLHSKGNNNKAWAQVPLCASLHVQVMQGRGGEGRQGTCRKPSISTGFFKAFISAMGPGLAVNTAEEQFGSA